MKCNWSLIRMGASGLGALALLASAALVTAPAQGAEKKQLYFVANGASDFWKLADAGIRKAQSELPDYSMQIKYPEQASAAIQDRLLDDLVANGAAGIMVSAVDPKTQTEELDKIAGQTLLLTTDSDAPATKRKFYIGSSNNAAGHQAGQLLKKALPNGGKCMIFVGLPGADNARERIEGIRQEIAGTQIQIVDVRGDDIDQARAKRNVEDVLTARSDVNCMLGVYSYNTPQIYLALQEAGKVGKITVVGFDNDMGTLEAVKKGAVVGTVVQQPFEWGYQGMKDMVRYLKGDTSFVPANGLIIVPTKIIDQTNVDAFWNQIKVWLGRS